ncbi:MAG: metal-dependent transcriptional regulator [Defluviitaleaceae bacterium]|nr:metal-dependent transcriptional regulator [Defluviitaleaceae bacterium]
MKTQESSENYLEAILMLGKNDDPVRAVDIAKLLDFSKPSVSIALKALRENGFITVNAGGLISLTETGRKIAESVYERHTLLHNWLIMLGVSEETALHDACHMEHGMSEESYLALKRYIEECS